MAAVPLTFTTINGIRIAEAIKGEGKPVLLLHGWGVHSGLVWALAEPLVSLGYKVYALDMPGFGQSEPPPEAWTVFDYARFVVAYLDHHGLEKVYLFGHSFGGRLSLILGADYPERVLKIVLADSAGVITPTAPGIQWRLTLYKAIRDGLYRVGAKSLADNLRNAYSARYGSADFKQASGVMRETFVKVVNQDLLPWAARVQPPALLFWGDQDEDTPLWQGQLLEKTIPDAGLVVHPGAGHYSYLDRLADTVRVMDFFFKQ